MFRQYEDPYKLEQELEELEQEYAQNPDNVDLYLAIAELKDRINFAWQDNEYDEDYAREYYPEYYSEECM